MLSILNSHGLNADEETLERYTTLINGKEGKRAVEEEITDKKNQITNQIQTDVKSRITDDMIKIAEKVPGVSSIDENDITESITNQIYSNPNQVDTNRQGPKTQRLI